MANRLKITVWDKNPIGHVGVVNVAPGGRSIEERQLPILICRVDGLPDELAGLVATSDLQAYDTLNVPPHARRLAGHLVAERLAELADEGVIPPLDEMGALLPGDYYAVPTLDRRGGLGDVRGVWKAFADRFRFVAGVAGNHDTFGDRTRRKKAIPTDWDDVDLLNGHVVEHAELRIGGVSGVLGKKDRAWRHSRKKLKKRLAKVGEVDLLILHEGPDAPHAGGRGSSKVREALRDVPSTLVLCGHRNWREPMLEVDRHTVVNVDSRVVVFLPAR